MIAPEADRGAEDVVAGGGNAGTPDARGGWDLVTPDAGGFEEAELLGDAAGPERDDVGIGTPLPVLRCESRRWHRITIARLRSNTSAVLQRLRAMQTAQYPKNLDAPFAAGRRCPGRRSCGTSRTASSTFVRDKSEWDGTDIVFEIAKKGEKTEMPPP